MADEFDGDRGGGNGGGEGRDSSPDERPRGGRPGGRRGPGLFAGRAAAARATGGARRTGPSRWTAEPIEWRWDPAAVRRTVVRRRLWRSSPGWLPTAGRSSESRWLPR